MTFAWIVIGPWTRNGAAYSLQRGSGPVSEVQAIEAPCVGTWMTSSVGSATARVAGRAGASVDPRGTDASRRTRASSWSPTVVPARIGSDRESASKPA